MLSIVSFISDKDKFLSIDLQRTVRYGDLLSFV